jgi:hypothetical protein
MFLSSFVGEEVDRSDLDAVREELLSTDAATLLEMETSHNPDRLKTCCEGHGTA